MIIIILLVTVHRKIINAGEDSCLCARRAQPWTVERSFSGDTMSPLNDKGHRNSCPSVRHGESYNDP